MHKFITGLLCVVLLAWMFIQSFINNTIIERANEDRARIDSLEQTITLLREHYETCSFIERDDVTVDHNGYFYSTYYRRYVWDTGE